MRAFSIDYDAHVSRLYTPCAVTVPGQAMLHTDEFGSMKALWDTGAVITTISHNVVERLHLTPVKEGEVNHVGGVSEVKYYVVDILLPGGIALGWRRVMAGHLNGFDLLVGMDVIKLGTLAVSNLNCSTMLSFKVPSDSVIDFASPKPTLLQKIKRALALRCLC